MLLHAHAAFGQRHGHSRRACGCAPLSLLKHFALALTPTGGVAPSRRQVLPARVAPETGRGAGSRGGRRGRHWARARGVPTLQRRCRAAPSRLGRQAAEVQGAASAAAGGGGRQAEPRLLPRGASGRCRPACSGPAAAAAAEGEGSASQQGPEDLPQGSGGGRGQAAAATQPEPAPRCAGSDPAGGLPRQPGHGPLPCHHYWHRGDKWGHAGGAACSAAGRRQRRGGSGAQGQRPDNRGAVLQQPGVGL